NLRLGRGSGGVRNMTRSQIETLDAATSSLTLSLDIGLYPRDVLYAAAYVFLDRAYVLLAPVESRFVVHFAATTPCPRPRPPPAARGGGPASDAAARPGSGAERSSTPPIRRPGSSPTRRASRG